MWVLHLLCRSAGPTPCPLRGHDSMLGQLLVEAPFQKAGRSGSTPPAEVAPFDLSMQRTNARFRTPLCRTFLHPNNKKPGQRREPVHAFNPEQAAGESFSRVAALRGGAVAAGQACCPAWPTWMVACLQPPAAPRQNSRLLRQWGSSCQRRLTLPALHRCFTQVMSLNSITSACSVFSPTLLRGHR